MAHRRRGVGVGRGGPKFQKKADELKAISLSSALETVEKLERKLTEFSEKHAKEIQTDPAFRQRFLQMCAPLGVDPLQSSASGDKKNFWNKVFGNMNDFYYELAVKVAEVCLASRSSNGGIMSLQEVKNVVETRTTKFQLVSSSSKEKQEGRKKRKQTERYSMNDIKTAISKLSKLGGGFRLVEIGSATMIVSVPMELDNDHVEIMALAQANGNGCIPSVNHVVESKGWPQDRCQRGLDLLVSQGMAWVDIVPKKGIKMYWFPSIWKQGLAAES